MPKIPQFQASSRLRTSGASISPGIAGAVGEAVAGVGQTISAQAGASIREQKAAIEKQKSADDAAFVTERTNKLLRQEVERLSDIETRGEDVDMSKLREEYMSRVDDLGGDSPSDEALAEFKLQADNAFTRKFFPGYSGHQARKNVSRRVGATTSAIDDIQSEVLTGRTGVAEALGRAQAAITGLEETSGGAVDIAQLRQRAKSGIATSHLTSRIQQGDGDAVGRELQEGKWDDFTTTEELAALQRQAAKAIVDAEAEAQAATEKNNAIKASNLEISVFRDEASYRDIDNATTAGIITPDKRTQLYKRLDSNTETKATTSDNLTRVQASISMGIPLDPTSKEDKEGVEQMWQSILPSLATEDPNAFANSVVSFTQSTGILPSSVKGSLAAISRSGDPQQASQAADIIGRLQEVNSPALNDLTKESYAFGLSVTSLVKGGVDQDRAVEIARKNAFGQTAQEKRTSQIVLQGASAENASFLNDKLDEFDPGVFESQPELSPVMQAEFEILLEEMVPFTNGDIDNARLMAWTTMKNVWGATKVNGASQMMKYAPEAVYGSPAGDNDWINDQFESDMTEAGHDSDKTIIGSDIDTARTPRPSYPVFSVNEDGLVSPALDENNLPIRWKPEFKSSPAYKELEEEQNSRLKAGKFKRTIKDTRNRWRQEKFEKRSKLALEFERAMNADN
jgi:hypothetical protein